MQGKDLVEQLLFDPKNKRTACRNNSKKRKKKLQAKFQDI